MLRLGWVGWLAARHQRWPGEAVYTGARARPQMKWATERNWEDWVVGCCWLAGGQPRLGAQAACRDALATRPCAHAWSAGCSGRCRWHCHRRQRRRWQGACGPPAAHYRRALQQPAAAAAAAGAQARAPQPALRRLQLQRQLQPLLQSPPARPLLHPLLQRSARGRTSCR